MHVVNLLSDWQALRNQIPHNQSIGFVPTMGNLHDGHSKLIKRSIQENDLTIVSIFVNEKQFNDNSDFINYPRTIDEDLDRLRRLGVDFCLMPSTDEIYADGFSFNVTSFVEHNRGEDLHRPGHFTGVLTVVMKLFQLVRPDHAYFGEKDYQQLKLIRGMAQAFFMPIKIIGVATFREVDGLAYSSRNNRLSVEGRKKAGEFAAIFGQEDTISNIRIRLKDAGINVEYIEDIDDRRLIAVVIDGIRLIDNHPLKT